MGPPPALTTRRRTEGATLRLTNRPAATPLAYPPFAATGSVGLALAPPHCTEANDGRAEQDERGGFGDGRCKEAKALI